MDSKVVLVTGGAGFIGSHLVERLLADGRRVIVVDNFDSFYDPAIKRRNISVAMEHDRYRLVEADIRDVAAVEAQADTVTGDAAPEASTESSAGDVEAEVINIKTQTRVIKSLHTKVGKASGIIQKALESRLIKAQMNLLEQHLSFDLGGDGQRAGGQQI